MHLIGSDDVARAFLAQVLDANVTVVAVSDASATVFDRRGVPAGSLLSHIDRGNQLASWPRAERIAPEQAASLVAADIVVDTTEGAAARGAAALQRGGAFVVRSPRALADVLAQVTEPSLSRVGVDAALGGVGVAVLREREELRAKCRGIALVAADGSDDDLAARLVALGRIVFGSAWGGAAVKVVPGGRGQRVARGSRSGELRIESEDIAVGSPLAAPADRTVAVYDLGCAVRVHTGTVVGAERLAAALVDDVQRAIAALEVQR